MAKLRDAHRQAAASTAGGDETSTAKAWDALKEL
jgi:hypothetical protein